MLNLDAELRFHALLEQALAYEGEERQRFLGSLEGEDPDLLEELKFCLEDEDDDLMGDFLELPAVDPAEIATAATIAKSAQPIPVPRRRGPAPEDWRVKIKAPRRIGPYEPIEPIGSGGMGKVYAARRKPEGQDPVGPTVALKVLRGTLTEAADQKRFAADIANLEALSHPHLAAILDGGISDGGHPYYGMEWVAGPTIIRYCQENRCSLARRLEFGLQVCRGLEYAHAQGITHLGLKPSNILMAVEDQEPCPKTTDIGIAGTLAHSLTESAVLTRGGLDMALYVSPEAIDSSRGSVDEYSDIYALGVLLFELMVGVLPVETRGASLVHVVQTVLNGEPVTVGQRWRALDEATRQTLATERVASVDEIAAFLEADLQGILLKAMAKTKTERHKDISELRLELEALLELF